MGDWDTTYTPNWSPFSFNAGNDQITGLSPFGKNLAKGIGQGMQGFGAAMGQPMGGGMMGPMAHGMGGFAQGMQQAMAPPAAQEDPQQTALMNFLKKRGLA